MKKGTSIVGMFAEGADEVTRDMDAISGRTAEQADVEIQKNTPGQTQAGSMLDMSSPLNTIVKSLFFLSLSPMFSGTANFYFISVGCTGAIIYSLLKQFNR